MIFDKKRLEIIRQALIEKFERTNDAVLKSEIVEMTSELSEELEILESEFNYANYGLPTKEDFFATIGNILRP